MTSKDEQYMRLALKEARKGLGKTSPNPCVGAIIVQENVIIAKGYHQKAGTPHAEIHALRRAGGRAKGATMYVTLEPCNHTGKTPPCSHAVAAAGLARVVVGMQDPNPLVQGAGLKYLEDRGIATVSGILEEECKEINFPFIKHITTGLPWLVMKAGVSLDGKLNFQRGQSGWITGQVSARKVHRLRNQYDAILVGSGTAIIDNPSLTTRLTAGKGKDAIRVILDRNLSVPLSSKVYHLDSSAPTWVFCGPQADPNVKLSLEKLGVVVMTVSTLHDQLDLKEIVQVIGSHGVTSVLVEGGAHIHGSFLQQKMFDYAHLFMAPIFAGDGGVSLVHGYNIAQRDEAISLSQVNYTKMGEDMMISGLLRYPGEGSSRR